MRSRSLVIGLLLGIGASLAPSVGVAADGDELRFGTGIGLGATFRLHIDQGHGLELDRYSQNYGFSFGVDLNRYVGIDVETSQAQSDLQWRGHMIGEYGMFTLIPQVRLSYPVLEGRLIPYLVAGAGFGHNEFNDRKRDGIGLSIHGNDTRVVGAVGIGAEYRVADNVGLGAELRYLVSRGNEIEIEGTRQTLDLDQLIVQARLRVLFPERGDPPDAAYYTDGRWYLDTRYGGAFTTHNRISDHLEAQPGLDAIGGEVDQVIQFGVGWDFTRHLGVELTLGGYSPKLAVPEVGTVAEYALYYVVPQFRARFPVLGGRLVPYALAGAGGSYVEVKDVKPRGYPIGIRGTGVAVAGALGGGVDYMVASNVALGFELEYLISRGNTITTGGHSEHVNLDALLMTGGLRIYFGKGTAH